MFCDLGRVRLLVLPRPSLAEKDEHRHNDADDSQPADHTTDDRADVGVRSRPTFSVRAPIPVIAPVPVLVD